MPIAKSRIKGRDECGSTSWMKHPWWPHIEIGDQGDVYDSKLGRLRIICLQAGYPGVQIEGKFRCIHRMIGQTWLGHPDYVAEGLVVRHIDGNPGNRAVSNMRLGTQRDNMWDWHLDQRGNESMNHCPRGHYKAGANLQRNMFLRGYSSCRTCGNAQAFIKSHPSESPDKLYANYYTRYVGDTIGLLRYVLSGGRYFKVAAPLPIDSDSQ